MAFTPPRNSQPNSPPNIKMERIEKNAERLKLKRELEEIKDSDFVTTSEGVKVHKDWLSYKNHYGTSYYHWYLADRNHRCSTSVCDGYSCGWVGPTPPYGMESWPKHINGYNSKIRV